MNAWRTIALTCSLAVLIAAPAAATPQRVFVSSSTSSGNLGGLAGADATCQELADAQSLGGRWIAWLSDENTDAIDRLAGNGPFLLIGSGALIAASRSELTSGTLQNSISRNEAGAFTAGATWTGTNADGTRGSNFCDNWTDGTNSSFGQTGSADQTDAEWTDANQVFCGVDAPVRIYCFEQGPSGVPALSPAPLAMAALLLLLIGVTVRRRRSASELRVD